MAHLNGYSDETIKDYDKLTTNVQDLINAAIDVRKRSYSPYSKFKVGAAVRTVTGEIVTGCNVENCAYGPSVCAERVAICKAISDGHTEFTEIAVVAFAEKSFVMPCGVCRQFLFEFAKKDIQIYVAKPAPVNVLVTSIFKLLPHGFGIPNNSD